jgi:UDP-N-acetylmuramate--alanine ligase
MSFADVQAGLARIGQIKRRFEIKGEAQGVTVIDDYGHHPREIQVTLEAMAQAFAGRRLLVAFQPHRFSRTQALLPDFFPIFAAADLVYLTDIYGAGEPAIPGLSGYQLYQGVKQNGHPGVRYVPDRRDLATTLLGEVRPGDVVVTMGAGDIWQTGEELLDLLAAGPLAERQFCEPYPVSVAEIC